MRPLCCFDNPSIPIVVDASVAINLNATGYAAEVIKALPHDVFMVAAVHQELVNGHLKGRPDAELTARLIESGLIEIAHLGEAGLLHFEQLVCGAATETLDDGEAATIAFAAEAGAIVSIDERKGTKICAKRFANLSIISTVDLLAHPNVLGALGRELLAEAVFNALQQARMSVQAHHLYWVAELVGRDRASQCRSLPRLARTRSEIPL